MAEQHDSSPWGDRRRTRRAPVAGADDPDPRVLARPDHPISRSLIDADAIKVLYRLQRSGYRAFLVGGSVRDLMLGGEPKDFDVATDAQPHELRRLFRNARIIGRRFRLAHILFKDSVVEVSTFRRAPDPDQQKDPDGMLITSDNSWGSPRQDAFRRDFTINALFYNIADFSVLDYVGGIDDLERRSIRVIGQPDVRFQEDPVRMLRACEFAGRLGFTIESATQESIRAQRETLRMAAPARLTEELLQLLKCGHAGAAIQWMLELGLLDILLPEAMAMVEARRAGAGDFAGVLPALDAMVAEGEELSDPVLLAVVLLPAIMLRRFQLETERRRWLEIESFRELVREVLDAFLERFSLAHHKRRAILQILDGFHRMCDQRWTPAKRLRFASRSYFDESLTVFRILTRATGEGREVYEHWHHVARQRSRRPEPKVERPRRRRRRSRGGARRRGPRRS